MLQRTLYLSPATYRPSPSSDLRIHYHLPTRLPAYLPTYRPSPSSDLSTRVSMGRSNCMRVYQSVIFILYTLYFMRVDQSVIIAPLPALLVLSVTPAALATQRQAPLPPGVAPGRQLGVLEEEEEEEE